MTCKTNSTRPLLLLRLMAGGALGGALATLVACDNVGDTEVAVSDASIVLAAGDKGAGSSGSLGEYRETQYSTVADSLGPRAGKDGYDAAAAVLAGAAQQGLAAEAYAQVVANINEADNKLKVLDGSVRAWRLHRSVEEAATLYDPEPRIEALEDLRATLQSDLEQAQKAASLVDQQIATIEGRMNEALENARRERDEAGRLQLESRRMSAADAAKVAEQVREHSRRADRYEFEAERLRTQASQLRPDQTEKATIIDRYQTQLDLTEKGRAEVAERNRRAQENAAEARQSAEQTRAEILEQVEALDSFVEGELSGSVGTTRSHLTQAISLSGKAGEGARDSASLIKGGANQRLGELHQSLASVHASIASMLEYLVEIGLDRDGSLARRAGAHRQSADGAARESESAYGAAASAFRSVRARGDAKEKLNDLADSLEGVEPEAEPTPEDFGADESDHGPAPEDADTEAMPTEDDGG